MKSILLFDKILIVEVKLEIHNQPELFFEAISFESSTRQRLEFKA